MFITETKTIYKLDFKRHRLLGNLEERAKVGVRWHIINNNIYILNSEQIRARLHHSETDRNQANNLRRWVEIRQLDFNTIIFSRSATGVRGSENMIFGISNKRLVPYLPPFLHIY